jgi:tetrahydromethanopterin S-methyltransferase subunit H
MDIRIIIRLNDLIMNEQTGSPRILATKLGITERSVYNYIAFMKREMKAPILYNSQRLSYVYNSDCDFKFNID